MFDVSLSQLEQLIGDCRHRVGQPPPLDGERTLLGRIVLDVRRISRGDTYWAIDDLPGSGHERAEEALARGATGILANRHVEPWAGCWSLVLDDPRGALERLVTHFPPREPHASVYRGTHTVLDISRHTSPDMLLTALFELRGTRAEGNRAMISGDLCSPQWDSGDVHYELGLQSVAVGGAKLVIACGRFAREVVTGARDAGLPETAAVACRLVEDGIATLDKSLSPGDAILVLGSRHLAMQPVVRLLSNQLDLMAA